jgi:hypothetical protein
VAYRKSRHRADNGRRDVDFDGIEVLVGELPPDPVIAPVDDTPKYPCQLGHPEPEKAPFGLPPTRAGDDPGPFLSHMREVMRAAHDAEVARAARRNAVRRRRFRSLRRCP